MNGGFGQMGGNVPGGPGQWSGPPNTGPMGGQPSGQPMGDPSLGGQAVIAHYGQPQQPMGQAQPQQGGGGGGPPPQNPLTAWIPSFPQMLQKVDTVARWVPWWAWFLVGAGVILLFKQEGWMAKVKKLIAKGF